MTDGLCDDCGKRVQIGEWPFDCDNHGHALLIRLAILPSGRTKEYAPPTPINPMPGNHITRDWMNPDGSTRPMAPDEWNKNYVGEDA